MTINNQTIDLDARQILLKRGNTQVNSSYIGPIGEITLDTTLLTLRVHDGVTPGGVIVPTEPTTRTWITGYLEGNLGPIVAATVANTTSTITDLITSVSSNVSALAANVTASLSQLVGNASPGLNTLEEISVSLDNDPALAANLRTLITAVQSNLNSEVARAFAAETILQTNINNEANARIAADTSLQSNIATEASVRSAADANLQNQINNILSNFDANILDSFTEVVSTVADINSNITAEANARIAADNSLQSNITAETNARTTAINSEASARTSADTSLQSNITAEVNARIQAVSDEANARIAADTSLQSNITAEVTARTQAVSDEANARVLADTSLQSNITAEVTARTQAVSDEANARVSADNSLQSNITSEVNARIQAVSDEANARVTADTSLQSNITAEVNARIQAVSDEANARIAADTSLQSNITAEANTRASADTSLQSNITALDNSLATVAKSGSYPDLINRPDFLAFNSNIIPDVDNTRFLGNSANRWHSLYVGPGSIHVGNISVSESPSGTILASAPIDLSNSDIQWANVLNKPNFATVATTGAYGDLSGVPTNLNQFTNGPDFANITYVNTAVSNEANLRGTATSNLQSQINNILNNTDPAALDSLSEIVTAFQSADGNLLSALGNISSATGSNLTAEINRATAAEANLQANISSEITARIQAVSDEANARVAADNSLQSNITAEVNARVQAVSDEANARIASDASLQSNITAEVNARIQAVSDEANARVSADSNLQSNIDSLSNSLANVAFTGTLDRLTNGNAEVVLIGGLNPFVTFPTVSTGENIYIQGAEIASTTGNVAITSSNSVVINTNALTTLKSWLFDTDGSLYFPDATVQTTAFTTSYITDEANARALADANLQSNIDSLSNSLANIAFTGLVDITDTNGLTTVFYPTFVEQRSTGQYVRADVDLTYTSDTNTLTTANITATDTVSTGILFVNTGIQGADASPAPSISGFSSISAQYLIGDGRNISNIQLANIASIGNIASINLDGNPANALLGDGSWGPVDAGIPNRIENGTTNVSIASANSDVAINVGSSSWNFNSYGELTVPGNIKGGMLQGVFQENGVGLLAGPVNVDIGDQLNTSFLRVVLGNVANNYTGIQGDIELQTYVNTSTASSLYIAPQEGAYRWKFNGGDGILTLAGNLTSGNSAINFVANSSGDGYGYSTMELRPDTNVYGDSYLIIDPTAPNHIHIRAGGTQDGSSSELYLGGENSHVMIGAGIDPTVRIKSNNKAWTFNTNGSLTLPAYGVYDTYSKIYSSGISIEGDNVYETNYAVLNLPPNSQANSLPVSLNNYNGNVQIVAGTMEPNATKTWTFDNTGNLTAPGNLIISTPTNLQFLDPSAGPITVGSLAGVGNIAFSDSTYQTTAWTGNITSPAATSITANTVTWRFEPAGYVYVQKGAYQSGDDGLGTYIGQFWDFEQEPGANFQVGLGSFAGEIRQGNKAVAIGYIAGNEDQGEHGVAVGTNSGGQRQGVYATALGTEAGNFDQGVRATAIGHQAGKVNQGTESVAIGYAAGHQYQGNNTIIINATGVELNGIADQDSSFYVAPVRGDATTANVLYYNTTTKEVTYGTNLVDRIKNESAEVTVANTGVVSLPAVGNSQITISGATKTVKGNPYYVRSAYSTEHEIWKASSADVVGVKITVRLHNDYYSYMELFDVMMVKDGYTPPNVSFSVGARIKSNESYPDGIVDVRLSDGDKLTLYYTSVQGDASFYTFDAVEFMKTV